MIHDFRSRAAALALLLGCGVAGMPVAAQTPSAPPSAAPSSVPSNRLFSDSTLVTTDRFSVEVVGSGPDVVLIPGLASSRETYRRAANALRGRYRLHLVQVAGFAGEPARANASGSLFRPTVDAIAAYVQSAKLTKPAVVGHSMGGLMALELALDHPDLVGKIMLVDTLPFYPTVFAGANATVASVTPMAQRAAAEMRSMTPEAYGASAPQLAASMAASPDARERVATWMIASYRGAVAEAMQEDLTTDLRPRVASLHVPLTVLYEASLAPLFKADYGAIPGVTLVQAKAGAKHFIMDDDPQTFDATLEAFLAK